MLRLQSRLLLLLILLLVVAPAAAAAPSLTLAVSHVGNAGGTALTHPDFLVNSTTGSVAVAVQNTGIAPTDGSQITVAITLRGGLTYGEYATSAPGGLFTCSGTTTVTCTTTGVIPDTGAGSTETISFAVTAPAGATSASVSNSATVTGGGAPDASGTDATSFNVDQPFAIKGITHSGNSGSNFVVNTNTGSVTVIVQANMPITLSTVITLNVILGGGLTFNAGGGSNFSCSGAGSLVTCTSTSAYAEGDGDTITFTVNAPSTTGQGFDNYAVLSGGGDTTSQIATDPTTFSIILAGTLTPTPTGTLTPLPTFPIPSLTVPPTNLPPTVIPTATFIPPPPTSTPLPRPANAGKAVGPIPQTNITVVVDRDNVNVRLFPAIGAAVIANVNAGYSTTILARSPDNQWVQINIDGQLGWLGTPILAIVSGDLNSAPVSDPRTIPYGGFDNPRAGLTSVTSQYTGKLDNSYLRVRGGPGEAYPVLANAPRYTIFSLLGRSADNEWLQVNFEGTLGWVATQFVDLQQGLGVLNQLPIDGIVADALPFSQPTQDDYVGTLNLMLSRVELAQPSLDSIRATWTNIALGGRVQCANFPARPTDYNIPNPVLAPFYVTLNPLSVDFNTAMTSLRQAIDLFIDICSRPQPPQGYVGQAVVQNALDAINQTDALFVSLRQRINALLPPQGPIDNNTQCLFNFENQSIVVPRLDINQPVIAHITAHDFVLGYCFDAGAGQSLRVQALKATGNALPRLTVSSFDDATNFIGSAEMNATSTDVSIDPILITQTGRYILILADLNGLRDLDGQIALMLTDVTATNGTGPSLALDPTTGNVIVNQNTSVQPATPGISTTLSLQLTPGVLNGSPTATPIDIGAG